MRPVIWFAAFKSFKVLLYGRALLMSKGPINWFSDDHCTAKKSNPPTDANKLPFDIVCILKIFPCVNNCLSDNCKDIKR